MFKKEDVIAVAEALVNPDTYADYDGGDYGSQRYVCMYCDGSSRIDTSHLDITHDLDCPVLIARDLLTKN